MASSGRRFASRPLAGRVLVAGLVGLALPLLALAIGRAGLTLIPYGDAGFGSGWGRLGEGLLLVAAVVLFLVVAAWPLLWALGVRPAWHVALLAPIAAVLFWLLLSAVLSRLAENVLVTLCLVTTLAYGLAALLTTPGQPWWWWQQLPLMGVGGPPPAPMGAAGPGLADPGIPLLAPDLPGYTVDGVATRPGGLRYLLRPPAPGDASAIVVIVRSRVEPPGEDAGYERAGPRIWRKAAETGTTYVVDRDDATIILKAGPLVPAEDMLQAATTLKPRPLSDLRGGTGS